MTIGLMEAMTSAIGEADTEIGGLYKTRLTSALQTGTALVAAYAWDGTLVVTTADTSEIGVGDWIRLNSDGQYFEIGSIVLNTSATITNPNNLAIPGTVAVPLSTQSSKAVRSLPVETTLNWDSSGKVAMDGIVYHYTSKTATAFDGVTHIAGGITRPGIFKSHRVEVPVVDLNRSRNAVDLLRRAMLVEYAEEEHLDGLGRNLGVPRTSYLTGDDSTFRKVIKALAYNPRGTIYGMELALDALVGAGNYEISEDLISHPCTVFINLIGSASTTLVSMGKAFIKDIEPQPATGNTTVDVSRIPIAVGGVRWKNEDLITDTTAARPSALDLDEYDGDMGRKEWTFVSDGGGDETDNVVIQPITTDSGCIEFTIAVDNNDAFYRHPMRIRPESDAMLEVVATIPAGVAIHLTEANQAALAIYDMGRALGVGCIQIDANNFGVGLSNPITGTLLVGSAVTLAKGTYHTIEIRKSGVSDVELRVNGIIVETALYTSFPASVESRAEFGIFIDPPTNDPFFRVRRVAIWAKTLTDYWNARGTVGQTAGANPTRLTDTVFNDFAAGDVGKALSISGSDITNPSGGNNNGRFVVATRVDATAITLVGASQLKADLVSNKRVVVPLTGYQFQYPDDLGKEIVVSGYSAQVIDKLLSQASGNHDLATLPGGGPSLSAFRETTNICEVVGTPFTAAVDLDWYLKPVFVDEGAWNEIANPKNVILNSVTYGNGVFVAVGVQDGGGDAYILRSINDGASWSEATNPKNKNLNAVAYGNGVFVAVGVMDGAGDAYLIRSIDGGVSWNEIANPKNKNLYGVGYGNGVFVAVGTQDGAGDAYLLRSIDDGASWGEVANPRNSALNAVRHGNGVFVAVGIPDGGGDAYLLRSIDGGATWGEVANPKNIELRDIAYGNGVFMAVGAQDGGGDAYLLRSIDDGVSWGEVSNPKNFTLYGVTYGNGVFVAGGDADGTDAYMLQSIDDGVSWSEVVNPKDFRIRKIAYHNSAFVAVGDSDGTDSYLIRDVKLAWEMSDAGSFSGPTLTLRQALPIANGGYTRVLDVLFSDVLSAQILLDITMKNLLNAYYPFYIADPLGFVRAYLDAITAAGVIPDFEYT